MKKAGLWKSKFIVMGILVAINTSGCSFSTANDAKTVDTQPMQKENENMDKKAIKRSESEEKEVEEILEICDRTYGEAMKKENRNDLEMLRSLVTELGKKGYTAVDKENQINMTEYEKVIKFCEKVEAKKSGRLTLVEVAREGSCIIWNMETQDGNVNMIRSYYIYEDNKIETILRRCISGRILGIYGGWIPDVFRVGGF